MAVPWLDNLCMDLTAYMPGKEMRKTRRLIARWALLTNILSLRRISSCVAKRFPKYEHLVEMGLMTDSL